MKKKELKKFLCDLVDMGEEANFTVNVMQFHEPSFKPRTKKEAEQLKDRILRILGEDAMEFEREHGGNTYSFTVKKGVNYYFNFAYKEVKE